jgi:hypothetical protein
MRKTLLVLIAVGASPPVASPCSCIERTPVTSFATGTCFDTLMDFDESDPKPTMEKAIEDAFADAGMARRVEAADLDPIIRAHPDGNLIHIGVDGYWVELATVQDGDGFVWVERPRPCSILDRSD